MGYIGPKSGYVVERNPKDYYRKDVLIARYVRDLKEGECPCGVEKDPKIFIDGSRIYRYV